MKTSNKILIGYLLFAVLSITAFVGLPAILPNFDTTPWGLKVMKKNEPSFSVVVCEGNNIILVTMDFEMSGYYEPYRLDLDNARVKNDTLFISSDPAYEWGQLWIRQPRLKSVIIKNNHKQVAIFPGADFPLNIQAENSDFSFGGSNAGLNIYLINSEMIANIRRQHLQLKMINSKAFTKGGFTDTEATLINSELLADRPLRDFHHIEADSLSTVIFSYQAEKDSTQTNL